MGERQRGGAAASAKMLTLEGEVAWISGGSSGIGRATAELLRSQGARVAVLDLQPPADPTFAYAECDIGSSHSVDAVSTKLEAAFGPPSILVTCAAISGSAPLREYPLDLWKRLLDVNLTGTFHLVRRLFAGMCDRGTGRIVLFTSDAAARPLAGHAGYAASKAGVIALGKTVATEGAPHGVTCNIVSPGVVDTPTSRARWASADALLQAVQNSRAANLLGVVLDPGDVASAVAYLVSPGSRYVTGQTLYVNAGALLP